MACGVDLVEGEAVCLEEEGVEVEASAFLLMPGMLISTCADYDLQETVVCRCRWSRRRDRLRSRRSRGVENWFLPKLFVKTRQFEKFYSAIREEAYTPICIGGKETGSGNVSAHSASREACASQLVMHPETNTATSRSFFTLRSTCPPRHIHKHTQQQLHRARRIDRHNHGRPGARRCRAAA